MPRHLEPGDPVRIEARPHGIALARPLARAVALALVGGVVVLLASRTAWPLAVPGALALALAAAQGLRAVLAWDRTRFVVTSETLVVVHGIVRRRIAGVELAGGRAMEVEQSLLGRLLGYGTVVVDDLEIPHVPDPREFARLA
jgi:uncharacterized membrane protein YdbT with pleckstrin-like domain